MCEMWIGRCASRPMRIASFTAPIESDGVRALVAQVRVVQTALRRRDFGELDDLFGRRVAAGRVVESGRHVRSRLDPSARHDRAHRIDLRGRRRRCRTSRALPRAPSLVRCRRPRSCRCRPFAIRRACAPMLDRSAAVVVRDDGRDALHEIREVGVSLGRLERSACVWVCGSMNPGRDDEPRRIDRSRRRDTTRRRVADECDSIAA